MMLRIINTIGWALYVLVTLVLLVVLQLEHIGLEIFLGILLASFLVAFVSQDSLYSVKKTVPALLMALYVINNKDLLQTIQSADPVEILTTSVWATISGLAIVTLHAFAQYTWHKKMLESAAWEITDYVSDWAVFASLIAILGGVI
ncbi:MAG: hypothetical protein ACPGO5_04120 [Patescibacteria group bacterium]